MTTHSLPILTSLLDTDAYKFYMQQAVFHQHYDVDVTAEFRCRSDDKLGKYLSEIAQQIEFMQTLALTDDEYLYLKSMPYFKEDYLNWLRDFRFNPAQVNLKDNNGILEITASGPWREVILWEIPLLSLISEIVHRDRTPNIGEKEAIVRLDEKISQLKQESRSTDMSLFKFADFGTRRRYSKASQRAIVKHLKTELPEHFIGTSNYLLAKELNLVPIGTQAHEWFQAFQQISTNLADSQKDALESWLIEYPDQLGIALTDCISMKAFLHDFNLDFATRYQGLRHDSGDPVWWGEQAIAHYHRLGIDPKTKTLVFSDSLDFEKALMLYRHFYQKIGVSFGIGTKLTCDLPGVTALNIVLKLVECNGGPVAKLSDSPGKTMCHDKAFIEKLQRAFNLVPEKA